MISKCMKVKCLKMLYEIVPDLKLEGLLCDVTQRFFRHVLTFSYIMDGMLTYKNVLRKFIIA